MFLHIQNILGMSFRELTRVGEVTILSKLLPSSLAGIFKHYKLNIKSILLAKCQWWNYHLLSDTEQPGFSTPEQYQRKSLICVNSYVKKRAARKSLKVLVLDWKQTTYPDKHLQKFENKKKNGALKLMKQRKRGEIDSCWVALYTPSPQFLLWRAGV